MKHCTDTSRKASVAIVILGLSAASLAAAVNAVPSRNATSAMHIEPAFTDTNWISLSPSFPGADGPVRVALADGSGNLYVGGGFKVIGDIVANGIAKWDGTQWSALGSGMNGGVLALAVSGNDLYAAGYFSTAGGNAATNIAKWNGSSWSALGLGVNDAVWALAMSGNDLYVGGNFTIAGGSPANNIAKWNGSSWSALGSGTSSTDPRMGGAVTALAVSGGDLYAGGPFTTAGGITANCVAKWNGSGWSALGSGTGGEYPWVDSLAVVGSELYAAGNFTTAGGTKANYVAKWDGSRWSTLGSGINGVFVSVLAVSGTNLYAGGNFTRAGGVLATNIARWNGSSWSAVGAGVDGQVSALAAAGDAVYAGGYFRSASGSPAHAIAKWNGNAWSGFGSGMIPPLHENSPVYAVATVGNALYVGGSFTLPGNNGLQHIAKWEGGGWSKLGSGTDGVVRALAASGNDLYAGGFFHTAGGVEVNHIAKWDGRSWSALGSGLGACCFSAPAVYALAVSGNDLYAAGTFMTAGGSAANRIAKWDGSRWTALGSGISDWRGPRPDFPPIVQALAVFGGEVYAGGAFDGAGDIPVANIAKWNGSSWSAMGSGINGWVNALAISARAQLYAGGSFTTEGGGAATNVLEWNGSSWSTVGSGFDGPSDFGAPGEVKALAVSGNDLYAAGTFTTADGSDASRIAQWNGSRWSALGAGIGGTFPNVYALAVSGSDLYAGGSFTIAGGKISAYVAKAVVYPPALSVEPDGSGGYIIRFSGVPSTNYRLQRAPALAGPWASSEPQTAPASGKVEFRDSSPALGQTFYRAMQP